MGEKGGELRMDLFNSCVPIMFPIYIHMFPKFPMFSPRAFPIAPQFIPYFFSKVLPFSPYIR
jgi:hypothetical protein